jgi:hypothetical protein
MKGFITRGLLMACASVLLATAAGCYSYSDLVDPCWPERYEYMARQEVREPADAQAHNGHVLDQTVWNCMFEPGTDRLMPGGLDRLDYLVRRRPCPDGQVFLQTAHDIPYDPAAPEKFAQGRCDLDARRIAAIQKYLTAASAGRHIDFQVTVHDPGDPSISAIPGNIAVRQMWQSPQGTLVGGTVGGAGAVPVSGGAGAVPSGAR